ncbi:MAG: helix-turn-helix domain-containing protein [Treponema sp.]|nr:helix-turn-helix domain-containing protein [Treponema sp.]
MAFWDNVLVELDYLGMTNKALAEKAGFDASNIGRGIKLGSAPSVETAVKIARVLNVSVEYLVNGTDESLKKSRSQAELQLFHKYARTIYALDALPEKARRPIVEMIDKMDKEFASNGTEPKTESPQ